MTCIRFGGEHPNDPVGFVCVNKQVRFHVGSRYIWMSWHEWTGPTFYTKKNGDEIYYDPKDETDPVWEAFGKWHAKQKRKSP
jgi:hypothetical protein